MEDSFIDLPKILNDELFGTLYADEVEGGKYYGNVYINGELVNIEFYIEHDEYEKYCNNLFQNAHKTLSWINSNWNALIRQAAENLVYEFDQENHDHPMWYEMFQKQVKSVLSSMKLKYIVFCADGGSILTYDDGGHYWGSSVEMIYDRPNKMDEYCVYHPKWK